MHVTLADTPAGHGSRGTWSIRDEPGPWLCVQSVTAVRIVSRNWRLDAAESAQRATLGLKGLGTLRPAPFSTVRPRTASRWRAVFDMSAMPCRRLLLYFAAVHREKDPHKLSKKSSELQVFTFGGELR